MKTLLQTSPGNFARLAGLLYLLIAICGGFSMGYVPSIIFVSADATATATNILANQTLVILGVFADAGIFLMEIILTAMLFMLLSPVNKTLALIAAFARLSMIAIIGINALFDVITLALLTNPAFTAAFTIAELHGLVLLFATLEHFGATIWQLFFTVHLLAIGLLVIRSGLFAKTLGVLMMIGSFGYTLDSVEKITSLGMGETSTFTVVLLSIVTIGELGFGLWMLIRGLNTTVWNARFSAA